YSATPDVQREAPRWRGWVARAPWAGTMFAQVLVGRGGGAPRGATERGWRSRALRARNPCSPRFRTRCGGSSAGKPSEAALLGSDTRLQGAPLAALAARLPLPSHALRGPR